MDIEEWRPVVGYEGRYEASSHGRVRSLGFYSGNRWGTKTWRAGRTLTAFRVQGHGYYAVTLTDGETQTDERLHRIVLRAFVGEPPPDRPNGLHEDDDPANNRVENLRWGTRTDNAYDSVANGSHVQARKQTCDLGHLLIAPNLVESNAAVGHRACLACKLAHANALHDERLRAQGRERTRYNRGRDGFRRRAGETWQGEAHRRYAHIMRDHDGLA
jgi:hypothetical protein